MILLQRKKYHSANVEELIMCLEAIAKDIKQFKELAHEESRKEKVKDIDAFYSEFKQKLQESAINKSDKALIDDKLKSLEAQLQQHKAEQQKLLMEKKPEKLSPHQKQYGLQLSQQQVEKHSKAALDYLLKEINKYRLKQHYSGGKLYICYAWAHPDYQQEESWEQDFLATLREHLRAAGITAILDIKDNQLGNNIYKFMEQAKTSDYVLVVGPQSLLKKFKQGITALATELIEILDKRRLDEKQGLSRVLPILLSGEIDSALPSYFRTYTTVRSWVGEGYLRCLRQLIERIYNIPEEDKTAGPFNNLWQQFLTQHPNAQLSYQPLPDAEIEKVIPKPVQAVKQKQIYIYQDCEALSKTAVPANNEKQKQQTLALCHRFFQTPITTSAPQDEAALKQVCEQANPLQEVELLPNAVQNIQPIGKLFNTLCHWLSNESTGNPLNHRQDLQPNAQPK